MTDRQLMQQALEALEANLGNWAAKTKAIAALRERLAHCDRCGKKLGGEGDIHTCTPPQRKPLTDKQILADEILRYYFGQNGGAGPVSKQGRKVVDAIEAAHGIKGEA